MNEASASVMYLAQWLEGFNGVNIRVLRGGELDWSQIQYSDKTRQYLKAHCGNEGRASLRCARYVIRATATDGKLEISESSTSSYPTPSYPTASLYPTASSYPKTTFYPPSPYPTSTSTSTSSPHPPPRALTYSNSKSPSRPSTHHRPPSPTALPTRIHTPPPYRPSAIPLRPRISQRACLQLTRRARNHRPRRRRWVVAGEDARRDRHGPGVLSHGLR